jgi:hypothetical protein
VLILKGKCLRRRAKPAHLVRHLPPIYSTQEGRCCIHGKQGCLRLRGKYACFPDMEDAKTLIKRFRAEGYTSSDPVERYVPEGEFVCLNRREQRGPSTSSRPMQQVS